MITVVVLFTRRVGIRLIDGVKTRETYGVPYVCGRERKTKISREVVYREEIAPSPIGVLCRYVRRSVLFGRDIRSGRRMYVLRS